MLVSIMRASVRKSDIFIYFLLELALNIIDAVIS